MWYRWKETKYRAKKKQLDFTITIQDFLSQYQNQNGKCYYTGRLLTNLIDKIENFSLSIDRVNSDVGYVKNNIVLCGSIVNKMKLNLSTEQFISICSEIVNR